MERLEAFVENARDAVIVGGGLIGIELAEMLISRNINVTFLVRESSYWMNVLPLDESQMINRHILEHKVDLRLSSELKEILSDESGKVRAITTKADEEIPCQVVGLAAGVSPNVDFLKNSGIEIGKGIKINTYFETNIPNIYAIGDYAEHREQIDKRPKIEAVWYTGRIMGEFLGNNLCGKRMAYKPGPWFNSAKFFDIEYQTYGWVSPSPSEEESQFYWEHTEGNKAIRLAFNTHTRMFEGINAMGIRVDHRFFKNVLKEGHSIDRVIANIEKADFEPEFKKRYFKEIREYFIGSFPTI